MIDLFLPSDPEHALSYFPAWLEVAGALGRAQLRIVDSGKGLVSPQTALPRRPPKIVSIRAVPKDGIEVTAAAPLYYHGFSLLASPEGSKIRSFIELSHRFSVDSEDESLVHLFVTEEELAQRLQAGQRYHFYLQPNGYPEVLGEARESWLYKSTL